MTKRKSECSPEDILANLIGAYKGGAEAVSQRLGIAASTLYYKLDNGLRLSEFSRLVTILEGANLDCSEAFNALAFRNNRTCDLIDAADEHDDDDLRKTGNKTLLRLAEFTGELENSLERGEICDKSIEALEPKKRRLIATAMQWWRKVKAKHAAKKAVKQKLAA
jgi:hypothetical protein